MKEDCEKRVYSLFKNKKGDELDYDVVFIIVTVIWLVILFLWVGNFGKGAMVLEKSYAKNIALLIDTAQPNMLLKLKMESAFALAEKNKVNFNEMVTISDNFVAVKLSQAEGYNYSFFNDVNVNIYPNTQSKEIVISVNDYNLNKNA